MEAERPMQNDEREQRDDADESVAREPGDLQPSEPAEPERVEPEAAQPEFTESELTEPEAAVRADQEEAEGFETPSWPQRDIDQEPVAVEPAADEPLASQPPPPDVEAYEPPPDATEPAMAAVAAHSVPATEPGESTRCPRCGTENRPGISFCRNCGQRLVAAGAPTTVARPAPPEGTQACPRCGTHNRAGVAFCQNCGANLRAAAEGYVPPAVAEAEGAAVAAAEPEAAGRAFLGPVVLLIGAIFTGVAWMLPFALNDASLFEQAFGSDGYGIAFWRGYDEISELAQQAYFGFAAPAPILVLLLVALAIAGIARRVPGPLQLVGLVLALVWAIGLVVLFVVVEVLGAGSGDLLDILRALSPGGIIFMLASLIVVIGALTRLGRG
jgi:Double zinc ribbon